MRSVPRAVSALALDTRSFATDASGDEKKPRQQQQQQRPRKTPQASNRGNNLLFGAGKNEEGGGQPRSDRKFSFTFKEKKNNNNKGDRKQKSTDESAGEVSPPQSVKKFAWAPSAKAKETVPELEKFDAPAYWNDDFPAEFDDSMKHEVEKLEVFADFTMLIDESWQKDIHPLFDGAKIELILNAPLEDFNETLFIDDKNTYDTKVVMEVPLSCFTGLSPAGLELVKQLAGPRYQANKQQLKLTEDRYSTRVHNHKRLCDVLRDLTQTAHELSTAAASEAQQ